MTPLKPRLFAPALLAAFPVTFIALFTLIACGGGGSSKGPAVLAPSISTQPASQSALAGDSSTFSVVANGTAPLSYQWRSGEGPIAGATSASYTTPPTTMADNGFTFMVTVSNAGGSITSAAATLTVRALAPTITAPPTDQSVLAGSTATFTVVAEGTAPLSYQWRKNGIAIPGATMARYTTPEADLADQGSTFTVTVSNAGGSITSSAATLTVQAIPPSLTKQPANQTVQIGSPATFSVVADGTAPLTYLWSKNGTTLADATQATYTTPNTVSSDNGSTFTVKVSNAGGFIISSAATLTVQSAPVVPSFRVPPTNQTVLAGSTATFTVTADGTAPLTYQWKKGATAIPGATRASYTTTTTTLPDSGSTFTVTVSNAVGAITSPPATLTVTSPPAVATSLAYANPTTGTFLLKRNPALSNASHLVLDLMGPSTGTGSGVSIALDADAAMVTWVDIPAGGTTATLVQNGTQFALGSGIPILKARSTGSALQATVAQKAPAAPTSLNGALMRIALDLKPGLGLPPNTPITFTADSTRCQWLDRTGTISAITVSVGTLTTQ